MLACDNLGFLPSMTSSNNSNNSLALSATSLPSSTSSSASFFLGDSSFNMLPPFVSDSQVNYQIHHHTNQQQQQQQIHDQTSNMMSLAPMSSHQLPLQQQQQPLMQQQHASMQNKSTFFPSPQLQQQQNMILNAAAPSLAAIQQQHQQHQQHQHQQHQQHLQNSVDAPFMWEEDDETYDLRDFLRSRRNYELFKQRFMLKQQAERAPVVVAPSLAQFRLHLELSMNRMLEERIAEVSASFDSNQKMMGFMQQQQQQQQQPLQSQQPLHFAMLPTSPTGNSISHTLSAPLMSPVSLRSGGSSTASLSVYANAPFHSESSASVRRVSQSFVAPPMLNLAVPTPSVAAPVAAPIPAPQAQSPKAVSPIVVPVVVAAAVTTGAAATSTAAPKRVTRGRPPKAKKAAAVEAAAAAAATAAAVASATSLAVSASSSSTVDAELQKPLLEVDEYCLYNEEEDDIFKDLMEEDAPAGSDDSSDAEEDGNFEGSDSEDMDVSDPEYNGTAATSATKTTPKGRARKVAGSGAAAKLAATSSASTRQRKLSQSSDSSDVPAQASGSIDKRSLKRLRNREAAARCRNRRRQLIDELSTQVAELIAEKTTMAATIARLEAELATTRGN